MISRRRRDKERRVQQTISDDEVLVDIDPILDLLEKTAQQYDEVRDRYLEIVTTQGGR